jgi:hypothetical protein
MMGHSRGRAEKTRNPSDDLGPLAIVKVQAQGVKLREKLAGAYEDEICSQVTPLITAMFELSNKDKGARRC